MIGEHTAPRRAGFCDHDRSSEHAARNDAFRRNLALAPSPHGVPEGAALYERVAEAEPHTAETDPEGLAQGAHERGTVTVEGVRVDWTIVPHDHQGRLTVFGFRWWRPTGPGSGPSRPPAERWTGSTSPPRGSPATATC